MTAGNIPAASATAPKRALPLYMLLAANTISLVGSMLTLVALPWYVLQTTGSPAKTGLTAFFNVLPNFISGVFGGTIVDRLGFRRASIIADLVSGFGIMMIPLLADTIGLAFWQLLGFVFVGSLLEIPGLTARRSLLPDLAAMAGQRLERVNSAYEGNQNLSLLLGPPIAGLLITQLGARNVLWIDAASFAVSAVTVAVFVPAATSARIRTATGRYRDQLVAGLSFLSQDRLLLTLAISVGISNFLTSPLFSVVLPVYAKEIFGKATELGLMVAAGGAGALIGVIIYGAIGHRLRRRTIWVTSFIVFPFASLVLVLRPSLPVLLVALAGGSMFSGPINPLMVTVRHERIPPELRGRVFSTFSAITAVASPLGMAVTGVFLQRAGLTPTLLTIGGLEIALGIAMFFVPALHELNRPALGPHPAPAEPRASIPSIPRPEAPNAGKGYEREKPPTPSIGRGRGEG